MNLSDRCINWINRYFCQFLRRSILFFVFPRRIQPEKFFLSSKNCKDNFLKIVFSKKIAQKNFTHQFLFKNSPEKQFFSFCSPEKLLEKFFFSRQVAQNFLQIIFSRKTAKINLYFFSHQRTTQKNLFHRFYSKNHPINYVSIVSF